jgi:amino acid transporter
VSIGGGTAYTIVVSTTVIFLFLSFTVPIVLGLMTHGTAKWDKMGPWDMGAGLFKLFCVLSIISMVLIFFIGIQPPNDWALWVVIIFLIITAIVWFALENRRFQGPPIGDMIAKRQQAIRAAEAAVGEKTIVS